MVSTKYGGERNERNEKTKKWRKRCISTKLHKITVQTSLGLVVFIAKY